MTNDSMLSDVEWQAKLAEENANFSRIKEVFDLMTPRYVLYARQYRLYYQALMQEGFSSVEALEIVKAHGWMPKG